MITKFDSLYAGHIDMDNVGYAGTAVNDRRFPNEHLVTIFDKAQAMAQLMDRLGYDTFWTAEHHFQYEGYECIPNVLMLAVHLAQVTRRLRFGCGFNITPMWHPLRLVRALTDQQIEAMGDPSKAPFAGLPTLEDAINKGGVLCGSPEQIIEHLKALEERYPGLEQMMVSLSVGVPKTVVLEQLERFATEVMPGFKQTAKTPALAG